MLMMHPSQSTGIIRHIFSKLLDPETLSGPTARASITTPLVSIATPSVSAKAERPKQLAVVSSNPLSYNFMGAYRETLGRLEEIANAHNYDLTEALKSFEDSFLQSNGSYECDLKMHCFSGKKVVDDLIMFIQENDLLFGTRQQIFDAINQYVTEASDQALERLCCYNRDLLQTNNSLAKGVQVAKNSAMTELIKKFVLLYHEASEVSEFDKYAAFYRNKLVEGPGSESVSHAPYSVSDEQLLAAAEYLSSRLTNALIVRHWLREHIEDIDKYVRTEWLPTYAKYYQHDDACSLYDSESLDNIETGILVGEKYEFDITIRSMLWVLQARLGYPVHQGSCQADELFQAIDFFQVDDQYLIWPSVHPLIEITVLEVLEEKGFFPDSEDRLILKIEGAQIRSKGSLFYVLDADEQRRHFCSSDLKKAFDQGILAGVDQKDQRALVTAAAEAAETSSAYIDLTPELLFYTDSWRAFLNDIINSYDDADDVTMLTNYLRYHRESFSAYFKQTLPSESAPHNLQSVSQVKAIQALQQLLIDQAFYRTDSQLFNMLLIIGISPDTYLEDGKTFLMKTVIEQNSSYERLLKLLNHRPNLKLVDHTEKKTAAMFAAQVGRADMLHILLESDNSVIETEDANGDTALVLTALYDQCDCIDVLKKHNATMDHPREGALTPLMAAVINLHKEVILKLLACGADVNRKDSQGRTAIMMGAFQKSLAEDYPSVYEQMLDCKADVDAQDDDGRTALMCAAVVDNLNALILLRWKGASMYMEANDRHTALSVAVVHENLECMRQLFHFGMSIYKPGKHFLSIPMLAEKTGNPAVIQMVKDMKPGPPHGGGVFLA